MNTLLTWLGKTDIDKALEDQEAALATIALNNDKPFDKIVILASAWDSEWEGYLGWLKARLVASKRPFADVAIHRAKIKTPIDYETILSESNIWIDKLSNESKKLTISLTSGTPAMIATAVILGKARSNVEFIQSSEKVGIIKPNIPVDFAKAYVKSAAKGMANKALKDPNVAKSLSEIIAKSPDMLDIIRKAKILAGSELPVLVLGETGTGKEVMSNAIHIDSLRADKPFKAVNCGALPQSLVDTILFGHEKGAFTGADKQHKGLFEQADGGTLFLDEVGELPADVQVKLLRVLQEGSITRVGGSESIHIDVRIIAATHRDLLKMVEANDFREDLFYRLAVGVIHIPSLRERTQDIPILVAELMAEINVAASTQHSNKSKNISEKGMEFILSQPWPGNIRELWNTLNRASLWGEGGEVSEIDLSDAIINRLITHEMADVTLSFNDKVDIIQLTDRYQKSYIRAALKASGNVKKHATQMLGLKDHQTLSNWMKRLDIDSGK
ncbi:sigma 54-dependent transcriptional activator [Paraglaciecola mesophila KMM 241]|uniref:Sigma 54-dependent transcriptional activator n=1 Tax=Paraglaciecola mesophila KMM 241 TaxID=1128912 RepID=K6XRN9_9ALTE|nr:sigma-54 dependent transcriptional regulator [Paraglaciecola mesophila]GAC23279.1 sigma 54-dependent transcriptional activator [Paraglaciecola mesophila KMM 241]